MAQHLYSKRVVLAPYRMMSGMWVALRCAWRRRASSLPAGVPSPLSPREYLTPVAVAEERAVKMAARPALWRRVALEA